MTTTITSEKRQEWVTAYKEAHKQLDRAQCKLSALINLIQGNGIDDSLKMDPSEREGLHNLLEDIADQIATALYEDLPLPYLFAELCGINGGDNE